MLLAFSDPGRYLPNYAFSDPEHGGLKFPSQNTCPSPSPAFPFCSNFRTTYIRVAI